MRCIVFALVLAILPRLALAAGPDKSDADHEIAAAQASIDQAAALNDQWTPTVVAFKAAKAAARQGDFAKAAAQAKRARELAELSIKQATAQKKLWRNEVVQ